MSEQFQNWLSWRWGLGMAFAISGRGASGSNTGARAGTEGPGIVSLRSSREEGLIGIRGHVMVVSSRRGFGWVGRHMLVV